MRPISPIVRSGLAIGLAVAATAIVVAQEPAALQSRTEAELAKGLFNARVVEAPFAAEAATTWTPPAGSGRPIFRSQSSMFRDRAGRVRVEQTLAGRPESTGPHRIFVRSDPQRAVALMLDTVAGTAVEVPSGFADMSTATPATLVVPVAMNCVISFHRPQTMHRRTIGSYDEEVVGQRMVHGVPATGTRFVTTLAWPVDGAAREMIDQRWTSHELGIVLHSRTEDPATGVIEHEVTRLSLVEPAARTFEIPANINPGVPFWPAAWENPHALLTWRKGVAPSDPPSR
jgi:hypothetical protein